MPNVDVEQVVREYLPRIVHMSLATSKDGQPWVCEVHFGFDDKLNLYFRSRPTTRHCQELMTNPCVAGNIVVQHELKDSPVGVYFEGIVSHLTEDSDRAEAFSCMQKRFGGGDGMLKESSDPTGHQFYKISVSNYYVFGRFGASSSQKYSLKWGK